MQSLDANDRDDDADCNDEPEDDDDISTCIDSTLYRVPVISAGGPFFFAQTNAVSYQRNGTSCQGKKHHRGHNP